MSDMESPPCRAFPPSSPQPLLPQDLAVRLVAVPQTEEHFWGQQLLQKEDTETNTEGRLLPSHPGDAHRPMWLGNHGSSWDADHIKDRYSQIPIAQVYWRLYRVMKDETHLVSFSSSSLPKGIVAYILGQENSTLKTGLWKAEKSYCLPMDF